jgi:hypothetical protein
MKKRSIQLLRVAVVFACAVLLIFSSLPLGGGKKAAAMSVVAQEIVVDEVEANDNPITAQEVPFPMPGEKVVIQGRVAHDDPGSLSQAVYQVFGSLDLLQDWFVADPDSLPGQPWGDGPIPLKITVTWEPRDADLDIVAGTTVDSAPFYYDGFDLLSRDQLITDANPEVWPGGVRFDGPGASIVRYLQPRGVIGVDGNPIPNDGFGRKLMIGIRHSEGAPVNYTVSIDTGPFSSEEHLIDDEGLTAFAGAGFDQNFVVTRFRPTRYPARLTTVTCAFPQIQGFPDPTGKSVRVIVFAGDSDNTLVDPPSNPTFLFDETFTIPQTGMVSIPIDPSVTINSGVVYVGFQFAQTGQSGVFPLFSASPVQYLRTYFSSDGGNTWRIPMFTEDLSGFLVAGSQFIRPTFEFGVPTSIAAKSKTKSASLLKPAAKIAQLKQVVGLKAINHSSQ